MYHRQKYREEEGLLSPAFPHFSAAWGGAQSSPKETNKFSTGRAHSCSVQHRYTGWGEVHGCWLWTVKEGQKGERELIIMYLRSGVLTLPGGYAPLGFALIMKMCG